MAKTGIDTNKNCQNLTEYINGQLNWEFTMWKFQDFPATQILFEINFGHLEAPKSVNVTV